MLGTLTSNCICIALLVCKIYDVIYHNINENVGLVMPCLIVFPVYNLFCIYIYIYIYINDRCVVVFLENRCIEE